MKQYRSYIILLLVIAAAIFGYKNAYKAFYAYKFSESLKNAAKINPNSWDKPYLNMPIKSRYKVIFVTNKGGEYSYAEYLKYAAEKKGWEVQIYYHQILGHEKEVLAFDPDFIMFTSHVNSDMDMQISTHRSKKYTLELSPLETLQYLKLIIKNQPSYEFNALLSLSDAVMTSAKEVGFYRDIFNKMKKKFNGFRILPSVPEMINMPAEPKNLVWMMSGGLDTLRSSDKYQQFMKQLSDNIPMKIYGRYRFATDLKAHVYDGYIPSALDMSEAIRSNGIYLLTHSDLHIKSATPTLRIFEAVAANAVVISDRHPFAIEYFGDNFLYFDQDADADTMYKQVKDHFDWIQNNPDKAKAMSERAHQIFLEKFTLEQDLYRIAKMHEFILQQEQDMGLRYPLEY